MDLYQKRFMVRRCTRRIKSPNLPEEMVFDILLRLSARNIYRAARLVSSEWYRVIHSRDFVRDHLRRSPRGVLIGQPWKSTLKFVSMQQPSGGGWCVEVSDANYGLPTADIPPSCDGLMAIIGGHWGGRRRLVYVVNPATMQSFPLPELDNESKMEGGWWDSCIAYAAVSMKYKVVLTYTVRNFIRRIVIFTVGVDNSWRDVRVDLFYPKSRRGSYEVFVTEGFVHYVGSVDWDWDLQITTTLNVETETLMDMPSPLKSNRRRVCYVSTGSSVTSIHITKELAWEVWELKSETGEWTMLDSMIDLVPHVCKLQQLLGGLEFDLRPVGWLNTKEVMLFLGYHYKFSEETDIVIAYNLCTRQIKSLSLGRRIHRARCKQHVNSLVCVDGQV